jgi:hypothetical protein
MTHCCLGKSKAFGRIGEWALCVGLKIATQDERADVIRQIFGYVIGAGDYDADGSAGPIADQKRMPFCRDPCQASRSERR